MKRNLLPLLAVVAVLLQFGVTYSANGQQAITITADDARVLDGSFRDAETRFADIQIGSPDDAAMQAIGNAAGANQVWDFTGFNYDPGIPIKHFNRKFDPNDVTDPGHNIAAYQNANCVLFAPDSLDPNIFGDTYTYFALTNQSLVAYGTIGTGQFAFRGEVTPGDLQLDFPMEFGKTIQSTFQRQLFGQIATTNNFVATQVIDGWGLLKTPVGDFQALRITETNSIDGIPQLDDTSIRFLTKGQTEAGVGWDQTFQRWASLAYTTGTTTGGGPGYCDNGIDDDTTGTSLDILLVVDDATNLNASDVMIRDNLARYAPAVSIKSDDVVTTADGNDRLLVVVSKTADASAIVADWASLAVPVISHQPGFYPALNLTDVTEGTDWGNTTDSDSMSIPSGAHVIANGFSGTVAAYSVPGPMSWGVPSGDGVVVATELTSGLATLFTFETGSALASGTAPARRAGFFMHEGGAASATTDGLILLDNTILWALGRDSLITNTVDVEELIAQRETGVKVDQNFPNPFSRTTVIPLLLDHSAHVKIAVFNALGQKVSTLVETTMLAGEHSIEFSADDLPRGVYFYRVESDASVTTRSMTLMH